MKHAIHEGEIDEILKLSAFKARQGLAGIVSKDAVLAMSISAEEAGMKASANGKKRVRGAAGSLSVAAIDLSEPEIESEEIESTVE